MNLRFKFFDSEKKEWFKPTYKPLNDLHLSGNGDVYNVTQEQENGPIKSTLVTQHIKVSQYTGIRDCNQQKYYTGSLVKFKSGQTGVLSLLPNGPHIEFDGSEVESVTEKELREAENVGHIFDKDGK